MCHSPTTAGEQRLSSGDICHTFRWWHDGRTLRTRLVSSSPAVAVMQRKKEEANQVLPVQKQKQRVPGARGAAVCWLSALIHARSLDVHQILRWKSWVSHCFQKNTACSRHHNVSLFFCSYSCKYYLQPSLADSKNSNMKLIMLLVNSSAPGQNLHRQSKGFVWSDVAEGWGVCLLLLYGVAHHSPRKRGQTFPRREKNLAQGQETLWVFFFLSHPSVWQHLPSSLGRAGRVLHPDFSCNPFFERDAAVALYQDCSSWHWWRLFVMAEAEQWMESHIDPFLRKDIKALQDAFPLSIPMDHLPDHQPWGTIECRSSLLFYVFLQLEIIKACWSCVEKQAWNISDMLRKE